MSSFLFILGYLLSSISNAQIDYCLWGVDDRTYSYGATNKNGLYKYAGEKSSGNYYYRLDRSTSGCLEGDYLYLYKDVNTWTIKDTPYGGASAGYFGECSSPTNTPFACDDGDWEIDGILQSNSIGYDDDCPQKQCSSITVAASSCDNTCDCNTFTQIGRNQFQYLSYIWWFNPLMFSWICINSNTADQTIPNLQGMCPENTTAIRFLSATNGYEGPFSGGHLQSGSTTKTFTFTCDDASNAETYSKSPTTPLPTLGPDSPSGSDGSSGGNTPAASPAASPATDPAASPASGPSDGSPSGSPSGGPSGSSTPAPTDGGDRMSATFITFFSIFALCISVLIV